MDQKTEKILQSLKGKKMGVFCDDSNLYYAYKKYGWRIDFAKLKNLLAQYCDLQFINYYIAIPKKSDADYRGAENFIQYVSPFVTVRQKPIKYTAVIKDRIIRKGDVDVEIVLDVVRTLDNVDGVIVLSGDSDFLELKNYVVRDKQKEIIFAGYKENMAWELRLCRHIFVNRLREVISLEKR